MKTKGFTIVELMVVVAIAAILLAIAIPSFNEFLMRGRRADAKAALLNIQSLQERHRLSNSSYGNLSEIGTTAASAQGYYTISLTAVTANGYTATAVAATNSPQAADLSCSAIVLTEAGPDRGTLAKAACWDR